MRVKANSNCFVGGARRRPGDVFEVPAGIKSKHFDPVVEAEKPKAEKKPAKETLTLSGMGKTIPKDADLV
jgi:hypothetical protein